MRIVEINGPDDQKIELLVVDTQVRTSALKINGNRVGYGSFRCGMFWMELPKGKWLILGRESEISEENAEQLVDFNQRADADEECLGGYFDYTQQAWGQPTALASLASWRTANNIKPEHPLLINKQTA
jgi:hypothetical protein